MKQNLEFKCVVYRNSTDRKKILRDFKDKEHCENNLME